MSQQYQSSVIEHILDPDAYQPLIVGDVDALVASIESLSSLLPKTVEIFLQILKAHREKHPSFEDWLLIPIYGFIWSKDFKRLSWIEDRFVELCSAIGEEAWSTWVKEIIQQTNCITTHRICDRIYDYFLHMYGGLYQIRQCWSIRFLPLQTGGPDILGSRYDESCVMECKLKHTSKKFESLIWRFDTACSRFLTKPLISSTQFRLPDAEAFQELPYKYCLALKEFVSKVYQDPEVSHKGIFGEMIFEYHSLLSPATSIDSQKDAANFLAMQFLQGSLSSTVERAAKQLNTSKYKDHQKFCFIGLQQDPFFSMPWTNSALQEVKLLLALKAYWKHDISVVFSDQVGFSMAGYL